MKKILSLAAFVLIVSASFAQVQRKATRTNKIDSASNVMDAPKEEGMGRKQMLKELDLTREQKMKLKELRQSLQSKKQAIESDDKLSGPEKEAKLKELRKEQAKSTMSVLTPEQKEKMLKLRKDKKGGVMEEVEN